MANRIKQWERKIKKRGKKHRLNGGSITPTRQAALNKRGSVKNLVNAFTPLQANPILGRSQSHTPKSNTPHSPKLVKSRSEHVKSKRRSGKMRKNVNGASIRHSALMSAPVEPSPIKFTPVTNFLRRTRSPRPRKKFVFKGSAKSSSRPESSYLLSIAKQSVDGTKDVKKSPKSSNTHIKVNGIKVNGIKVNGKKDHAKSDNGRRENGRKENGKKHNGKKQNGKRDHTKKRQSSKRESDATEPRADDDVKAANRSSNNNTHNKANGKKDHVKKRASSKHKLKPLDTKSAMKVDTIILNKNKRGNRTPTSRTRTPSTPISTPSPGTTPKHVHGNGATAISTPMPLTPKANNSSPSKAENELSPSTTKRKRTLEVKVPPMTGFQEQEQEFQMLYKLYV